ncbi:tyrosine-protein phosphatase [Fibrella arboris]|uniref:tyrosine-protein phosphatase n=1 Tax=Fibrella arboris TaxID=3242486 RepID=UPI00351FF627
MFTKSLWQRFFADGDSLPSDQLVCPWPVDMHSHLLPGLDDGAVDLAETLTCLKQLADWGIQQVITTPHVSRDWYPNSTARILEALDEVRELIAEHQLPITIEAAAEYLLDDFFLELLNTGDLLSFGAKRYLLVESGWAAPPFQLYGLLFRIQTKGYKPVLAHPERYKYYHTDREALSQLRQGGCLFQLNWMSLTGRYGTQVEKQARFLLEQNWVDFIGSDLHRPHDLKAMASLLDSKDLALLEQQHLLNVSLLP